MTFCPLVKALAGICALAHLSWANTGCRYTPGDPGWPSSDDWSNLNNTVHGQLIKTIPQASVCHTLPYSNFNQTACEALQSTWSEAQIYETKPAEIMNGYYQNQSCDPFTAKSRACDLGNYAVYSINVSSRGDVLAGIEFARQKNIRLVIKSTGHDYNGKSSGKGALSLWMFNLKTVEIIDQYESDIYTGPAIKLGPGVIAGEAYEAAARAGYRIVGGECASVSLAGGYTQGGGHSMLNSAYGTAADNVLEWEVVTANGECLVATPHQNSDLYWALSGGGGGTYGVVLSMTTKVYRDGPVASATLTFGFTDADNGSTFWDAIGLWFQNLPSIVSSNNSVILEIENNTFSVVGLTLPDQTVSDAQALVAPFLADLDRLHIAYNFTSNISSTFVDYFASILGPLPYGPYPPTEIWNSRLVPRSVVLNTTANSKLIEAFRKTVADGTFLIGCNIMNVANTKHPDNSVLPAWRDAIALCNINAFWDFEAPLEQNLAIKEKLVSVYTPIVEEATPGSGVYLNEIDPWYKGDWKQEMYGANYPRLLSIKHVYDPDYLLYGHFAVGSDEFSIDESGRLCRV
ncbi:putative FAD-dependent isoamyl alcohol oxidase [Whalleya microplaca]|nr:putative FAD-dependent isoamyl alcohol oxidase [Whalleya microplaca]